METRNFTARNQNVLDLDFVRSRFPALSTDWALFDNAGGSVPLASVIDGVASYMGRLGVQLGASYDLSVEAGERVQAGHRSMEELMVAESGEVILGPSTTVLLAHLARALRPSWREGDEVIVTDLDHEANIGPWRALGASGIVLKEWKLRRESASLELEDLKALLTERTRLVAVTHCSNIVGRIHDVSAMAEAAHGVGARVCVDGVAFAPHRRIDVRALGVDFYVFSTYKTYGPHQAVLWGRRELLAEARSQNHFFVGEDQLPAKMEPGGPNHELAASLPAIPEYLESLATHHGAHDWAGGARSGTEPNPLDRAFELIATHERALAARVLEFLSQRQGVRVIGPESSDAAIRVPTISFVAEGRHASEIPTALDGEKVAIRWGDFYAKRAVQSLGLQSAGGVIRISMVHYNTLDEVDRLIRALDRCL